jgi:hypothetical protein
VALKSLPELPANMIMYFRSNKDTMQSAWQLKDSRGNILKERKLASMHPFTLYQDTLNLSEGYYTMTLTDTGGDGLDFWFNTDGGYGYARLTDIQGHLLKAFNSDFGSDFVLPFHVSKSSPTISISDTLPLLNVFPIRNPGKFDLDIYFDNQQPDMLIEIKTLENAPVLEEHVYNFKQGIVPIDISTQPDGFYMIYISAKDGKASKKIKVKKVG